MMLFCHSTTGRTVGCKQRLALVVWIVLPLVLLLVLARVAQRYRTGAATQRLFQVWNEHIGEPAPIDEVKQLLEQGADVNQRDIQGRDSMHYAAEHGPEMMRLVLDYGADVNTQDNDGNTPLLNAISCYDVAGVRFLLQTHADPNLVCYDHLQGGKIRKTTALSLARLLENSATRNHRGVTQVLALRAIIQMLKAAGARDL